MIDTIAQRWQAVKDWADLTTGAGPDLLHVHAGLALWLIAAFALRKPLRDWRPLIVVALLQALNEVADHLIFGWRWQDTTRDTIETVFWPLAIMLFLRWRRQGR